MKTNTFVVGQRVSVYGKSTVEEIHIIMELGERL